MKSLYSPIPVAAAFGGGKPNKHQIRRHTPSIIVNTFGRIHHHALPLTGGRVAVRVMEAGMGCSAQRVNAMKHGQPSDLSLQAPACLGQEDRLSPPGEGSA